MGDSSFRAIEVKTLCSACKFCFGKNASWQDVATRNGGQVSHVPKTEQLTAEILQEFYKIHRHWSVVEDIAVAETPRPFDAKMIEHLVGLMGQHDLAEIDLHEGEQRIRLRRGALVTAAPVAAAAPAPAPAAMPTSETPKAAVSAYHEIKSPMVGTFYAKPSPDKDDYVKVGSQVKPDSIICKLEAMKLFNDLAAECTGTIKEVCVKNGQPVDFGTVLFRVEITS